VLGEVDITLGEAARDLPFIDESPPEQVAAVGGLRVVRGDESSDDRAVAIGSDHQIGAKVPVRGPDHGLVSVLFRSDFEDTAAGPDAHGRALQEFLAQRDLQQSPCRCREADVNDREGAGVNASDRGEKPPVDADAGTARELSAGAFNDGDPPAISGQGQSGARPGQ
jgi:hypothetical protein